MSVAHIATCSCGTLFRRLVKAGLLLGLWVDRTELTRVAIELGQRERGAVGGEQPAGAQLPSERRALRHEPEPGCQEAGDRDRDLARQ
jgi:hypothetical protein